MPLSRRLVRNAILAGILCAASPSRAQDARIEPVDDVDVIHQGLSIGVLAGLPIAVTPCQQDLPTAAILRRRSKGVWAARLKVDRVGSGAWTLVVQTPDGSQRHERPVGDAAPAAEWLVGPLYGNQIEIHLRGPARRDATCPIVRLLAELQEKNVARPRGLVGAESRWNAASTALAQAPDSAALRNWGDGVVYVETLASATALIPCTGFYISQSLVLTAAHCLERSGDISRTRLRVGDREIRGTDLTLLVKLRIDFAIVMVKGPPPTSILRIGDRSTDQLVMWQTPRLNDKVVSVEGCAFDRVNGPRIQHKCDTSDGSSGSPLQVRGTGAVIGIQVIGCLADNETPECVNHALRVEEIRSALNRLETEIRAFNPAAADELFAALRPPQQ